MHPTRPLDPRRAAGALAVLWALASAGAASAHGQQVRGTLTTANTLMPIEGAMVHLLDSGGAAVDSRLTNGAGRFFLNAGGPGTYTVRADRIGHASTHSEELSLSPADTIEIAMVAQIEPIVLEALDVRSDKRCVLRPEEGEIVYRVWNEARKALEVAAWGDAQGVYQYRIRSFNRLLDPKSHKVQEEQLRTDRGWRQRSFVSMPAIELTESGFVRPDGDGGWLYAAPDADVLLSDAFLDTHCFRLREGKGEAAGLIGLGFEPVRGRRVSDIEGTFWIDRENAELRWLEFNYVRLNLRYDLSEVDLSHVGGRVDFQRVPSGGWIVRRWEIRMPVLAAELRDGRRRIVLGGIRQNGGEVVRIEDGRGKLIEG